MTDYVSLVKRAYEAQKFAYAPYSKFKVGAALLCRDGKVFSGCNVESSTFTPTSCAERTAIFKAVSEGEREFLAIAIVGNFENVAFGDFCAPCGVCRQVMCEFCSPDDFEIVLGSGDKQPRVFKLKDLMPEVALPL